VPASTRVTGEQQMPNPLRSGRHDYDPVRAVGSMTV